MAHNKSEGEYEFIIAAKLEEEVRRTVGARGVGVLQAVLEEADDIAYSAVAQTDLDIIDRSGLAKRPRDGNSSSWKCIWNDVD